MVENQSGIENGQSHLIKAETNQFIENALDKLSFDFEGERLFRAADPGYPQNFTRDSLISARLMGDIEAKRSQIDYSARFQGVTKDPLTGEEPGKIHHERHHELPMVIHNELGTAYNACDTTALFLEAVADVALAGDVSILEDYKENISQAVDYIRRHIKDGLFIEDPSFSDASRYGLKVTYWKDSVLNHPDREEPAYPVVYTQPHFQNANALLQIGYLLEKEELMDLAISMFDTGFEKLWAGDHFVTAIDAEGVIDPPSSDSLMSLLHIPSGLLPEGYGEAIEEYMVALETPAGYLSGIKAGNSDDEYHTRYVWTHEQGLLHMAAFKHNLRRSMKIAERVTSFIDAEKSLFPELLEYKDDKATYIPAGNDLQLWCVAMYKYFDTFNPVMVEYI